MRVANDGRATRGRRSQRAGIRPNVSWPKGWARVALVSDVIDKFDRALIPSKATSSIRGERHGYRPSATCARSKRRIGADRSARTCANRKTPSAANAVPPRKKMRTPNPLPSSTPASPAKGCGGFARSKSQLPEHEPSGD